LNTCNFGGLEKIFNALANDLVVMFTQATMYLAGKRETCPQNVSQRIQHGRSGRTDGTFTWWIDPFGKIISLVSSGIKRFG